MNLSITGTRLELGRVLAQHSPPRRDAPAHVNLSGQQANTLLHDGHAWKGFPRTTPSGTRRALRAARSAGATLFVHASFAFVHAVERGSFRFLRLQGMRVAEQASASAADNLDLECFLIAHWPNRRAAFLAEYEAPARRALRFANGRMPPSPYSA
jgi:hypothetical protein